MISISNENCGHAAGFAACQMTKRQTNVFKKTCLRLTSKKKIAAAATLCCENLHQRNSLLAAYRTRRMQLSSFVRAESSLRRVGLSCWHRWWIDLRPAETRETQVRTLPRASSVHVKILSMSPHRPCLRGSPMLTLAANSEKLPV